MLGLSKASQVERSDGLGWAGTLGVLRCAQDDSKDNGNGKNKDNSNDKSKNNSKGKDNREQRRGTV